ncbi:ATP-dependent DNA ligase, partial [Priestia megaterium]|uniref:ATP-dependent DNA ligase n=1 Tax=Priestia megaterium TaxID=1404 RepID=UPI000BFC1C84
GELSININKVFGIFNQLKTHSAKSVKEQILKQHEKDEDFRKVLSFVYNPYIVTGISTKKMKKKVHIINDYLEIDSLDTLIDYLLENNSGRDYDIINIHKFINTLESDEHKEFVQQIVTKDLKVGITEKTINKVYGAGTIPSFAVMLAESYAKKEAKVKGKFYVTLKLDGNRCVAFVEKGSVKFFTRKGQEIDGMTELALQFSNFPYGVYDGELLLKNTDNLPSAELFRATQKIVRKDGEKKDLEFHIFDMVTIEEFKAGKSNRIYAQRRNTLDAVIAPRVYQYDNIHVLPVLYEGEDKQVISRLMLWAEEKGYEGLMVNTAEGLYLNKRTDGLLKVKTMKTADLLVMTAEKAIDGQFKDLLSRVNVEFKGNLVGVGSGFTLDQRKEFIENSDLIVGKIIEVQYFEETKDEKTGQPSLRFPVFKGIRHDKGVEDINYGE